jgi:hypothetical protein
MAFIGASRVKTGDWAEVYFLAFLNPSQGQPDPALTARLASPGRVGRWEPELEGSTAHSPAAVDSLVSSGQVLWVTAA